MSSARIDLGYSEKCEYWQLTSPNFPSKIGGKPAWLDYKNIPSIAELQCDTCKQQMIFLCQIYSPYEDSETNFHRTIFIFICKFASCCKRNSSRNIKVFRNSLPRNNQFYSYEAPQEDKPIEFDSTKWIKLCNLCGCLGEKACSKCKQTVYCSKEHQLIDWKENHRNSCGNSLTTQNVVSKYLYPETEIVIEAEEIDEVVLDEVKELQVYEKLVTDGNIGTLSHLEESELDEMACIDKDQTFSHFRKRIEANADQILRYERGGKPLLIAKSPLPENIPNCESCSGKRHFEFQIMPQLLSIIKESDLDFGILCIYTCEKSCNRNIGYQIEYVFKQDVDETDLVM